MKNASIITLAFTVDSKSLEDARAIVLSINARRGGERKIKKMAGDAGLPRLKKDEFLALSQRERDAVHLYSAYVALGEVAKQFGHVKKTVTESKPAKTA